MTKDKALKLALEALETELAVDMTNGAEVGEAAEKMCEAITAIKEALAQQEQEPIGVVINEKVYSGFGEHRPVKTVQWRGTPPPAGVNVYTSPPVQRIALPDAITDDSESSQYRTGWNECLEAMKGMSKEVLAQPERSMKVEGPLHVVCQCDKCKAQPEQEPVLWMMPDGNTADKWALQFYGGQKGKPLYTTPQALAQPEQEPVAYLCENAVGHKYFRWKKPLSTYKPIALYTTPPQRKPLTDEEILTVVQTIDEGHQYLPSALKQLVRAIEAAHGIKGEA